MGAPIWPPIPPTLGGARANPWRPSKYLGRGEAAGFGGDGGEGWVVADRSRRVAPPQPAVRVQDRHAGELTRIPGDLALARAPAPGAPVVEIRHGIEQRREADAAEPQRAVQVLAGIDEARERRTRFPQAAGLGGGARADRDHADAERHDRLVRLAHLREVVEAGDSAVVT